MPRKKKYDPAQPSLFELSLKTAPCVPAIRQAVRDWAINEGYKGATKTSKTLLNYWFKTDHRLSNGAKFAYYPFQREAVETLIYLYEIAQKRRHKELIESYVTLPEGQTGSNLRLLQYDLFPRYCLKMATGSGKTKVMALATAFS